MSETLKKLEDRIREGDLVAVFACGTGIEIGSAEVQTFSFVLIILK